MLGINLFANNVILISLINVYKWMYIVYNKIVYICIYIVYVVCIRCNAILSVNRYKDVTITYEYYWSGLTFTNIFKTGVDFI